MLAPIIRPPPSFVLLLSQCRGDSSRPDNWHGIGLQPHIARNQRQFLDVSLCHEHPIKRICVVWWQRFYGKRVRE